MTVTPAAFAGRKILVLGDIIADQFQYGAISRVSREAPVLILQHERTETVPGGAANCALNLAALGARAVLLGVVGADVAGAVVLEKLAAAGVDVAGVVVQGGRQTTTKTRILAGQLHSTRQQILRIDYENGAAREPVDSPQLAENLRRAASDAGAVIVSDYGYGVADAALAETVREMAAAHSWPWLVDSRYSLTQFAGATTATPNQDEVEKLLGCTFTNAAELTLAAMALRARLGLQALLVTRGSEGMLLLEKDKEPLSIAPVGAAEPVDVTGAGDTVIAVYALALASGASFADAARLANRAGGLVVMKRGTATISASELL